MESFGLLLTFLAGALILWPSSLGRWFAYVRKGYNEAIREGQEIDDSECADDQETRAGDAA